MAGRRDNVDEGSRMERGAEYEKKRDAAKTKLLAYLDQQELGKHFGSLNRTVFGVYDSDIDIYDLLNESFETGEIPDQVWFLDDGRILTYETEEDPYEPRIPREDWVLFSRDQAKQFFEKSRKEIDEQLKLLQQQGEALDRLVKKLK